MPLTAAEKQRRYRERLRENQEKLEDSKRKARERYHSKKILVSEMSVREKRLKIRFWRNTKRTQRERNKNLNRVMELSPPPSPVALQNQPVHPNLTRGRKRLRRDRSKFFRENQNLKLENAKLLKDKEKYRKRAYRADKQLAKHENEEDLSPFSKTEKVVEHCLPGIDSPGLRTIKRQIFKYNTLTHALVTQYKDSTQHQEKTKLRGFLKNKQLRKYRLQKEIRLDALGLRQKVKEYRKKKIKPNVADRISKFFQRDDVSRATAGKKETVSRNKQKVQKRFLLDSMKNLFKTFLKEGAAALTQHLHDLDHFILYHRLLQLAIHAFVNCIAT